MQDSSHLLSRAAELHQKGNLSAAEGLYLQVLRAESGHFDALQMLGMLRYQQGRLTEALSLIGAALATKPHFPPVLLNYAVVLDGLRRREEALAIYDRALALKPDYAEAWFNRGILLRHLKRVPEFRGNMLQQEIVIVVIRRPAPVVEQGQPIKIRFD